MMLNLELDDELSQPLAELAQELHISTEELAKTAIRDWLAQHSANFEQAARYVLEKNRELYRRLG